MNNNDCVLLVEGPNDKHVVRHLCNRHQAIPEFCIRDKGGIEGLLEDIGLEMICTWIEHSAQHSLTGYGNCSSETLTDGEKDDDA